MIPLSMIGAWQLVIILLLLVLPLFLLFPILAIVSVVRNEFPNNNDKLVWILLIIFLPFLGSLLYFLIGRPKRIQ